MKIEAIELEDLEFDKIGSWPKSLRVVLLIAMGLITIMLGYGLDLKGLYEHYIRLRTQRKEWQTFFEKAYDQASNLEEYKNQIVSIEKSLATLEQQLPKSSEEAQVLEELSRQAVSSGLTFLSFKPLREEFKGFYTEHAIELSLKGGYHCFGEFSSRVASIPRIVTLHDFSMKAKPTDPKVLDIFITVRTYWVSGKLEDAVLPQEKPL